MSEPGAENVPAEPGPENPQDQEQPQQMEDRQQPQQIEDRQQPQQVEDRQRPQQNQERRQLQNEMRIVNIPESPLERIDRKLQEIKDKTDGIPYLSNEVRFNNEIIGNLEKTVANLETAVDRIIMILQTVEERQGQGRAENSCPFCNDNHYASDCTQYKTLTQRRNRCNANNRCERCLLTANHMATSCGTKSVCYYCKREGREEQSKGHNSAFCPFHFPM
ncbi:unnamed protein product [Heligmosomoides polygyrus]|uniref:CCHC-type domain-containing protein n=1 Tax=Heligmosomoides polygyrus TaxID=6339 RepID=A0A183G7F0_HELPZ|nr:unnamed protein product [Heligmosomoides polygyrus]